jgi:hypothetical protein
MRRTPPWSVSTFHSAEISGDPRSIGKEHAPQTITTAEVKQSASIHVPSNRAKMRNKKKMMHIQ